jgi:3-keto-L-gulonate-6-phosphate decarboxylase
VTSIGKGAFDSIFGQPSSVTNLSKNPQEIEENVFGVYGTLHVLPGCKAVYEAANAWKNFTIVEDAKLTPEIISDMIASIGKVEYTATCKAKIATARSAYDALTKEQQALVKNLSTLVDAENAYKQLEATGIADIETSNDNKDRKFLENGKIVIVRNGKKYNLKGQAE